MKSHLYGSNRTADRATGAIVISGFGLVSAVLTISHGLGSESVVSAMFGVVPPLVISIGFVVLGAQLYRRRYDQKWVKLLQKWHLIGAVVGGVIALVIVAYQESHGIALFHRQYLLYNTVVGGAGIGTVFGYYDLKVQQRAETLETSSDIFDTLREIHRRLATADDRETLEQEVCETIADAEPYAFAWVGEVDDDDVVPRTWAGVEAGYLDEISITVEDGPTARGPAGTAVRTREPQVVHDVAEPAFEPWRDAALKRGFQSSMAIPLVHEDAFYGLLCIYADRSAAFTGREFDVLVELGDTIADSIDAIELRESQGELLDSMDDTALVYSLARDSLVAVNQTAVDRLGYSREELLSMHPDDFDVSEVDCVASGRLEEIREAGQLVFETVHETKGGEHLPVEINATAIQYRGEPAVLAVARDIRERKAREQRLRSYREALDQAGHAIYLTDTDGTIEYVNPAFETQTGYRRDEVIGETPRILQSGTYDEAFYEEMWQTILDGDVWHYEGMVDQRRDGTNYYVDQTIAPITDEDGEIERFVAVAQDITALKEHEETLEEQTRQLELFNRIIRHDIRNDMQVVLGRSRLLKERLPEEYDSSLRPIIDHSKHVVDLTRTVRNLIETLLSEERRAREPVELQPILDTQISDLRSGAETAEVSVENEIPSVTVCASDMLGSVFRNVLTNAVEHNPDPAPSVSIRTRETASTVTVEITDDGPGIPDRIEEHIFQKGQRGLESRGTGLGLYLADVLVDQYDGDIQIADTGPDGTTVAITLQKSN